MEIYGACLRKDWTKIELIKSDWGLQQYNAIKHGVGGMKPLLEILIDEWKSG